MLSLSAVFSFVLLRLNLTSKCELISLIDTPERAAGGLATYLLLPAPGEGYKAKPEKTACSHMAT